MEPLQKLCMCNFRVVKYLFFGVEDGEELKSSRHNLRFGIVYNWVSESFADKAGQFHRKWPYFTGNAFYTASGWYIRKLVSPEVLIAASGWFIYGFVFKLSAILKKVPFENFSGRIFRILEIWVYSLEI